MREGGGRTKEEPTKLFTGGGISEVYLLQKDSAKTKKGDLRLGGGRIKSNQNEKKTQSQRGSSAGYKFKEFGGKSVRDSRSAGGGEFSLLAKKGESRLGNVFLLRSRKRRSRPRRGGESEASAGGGEGDSPPRENRPRSARSGAMRGERSIIQRRSN